MGESGSGQTWHQNKKSILYLKFKLTVLYIIHVFGDDGAGVTKVEGEHLMPTWLKQQLKVTVVTHW